MPIPGVPAGSWPGCRPGLEPGDFPGQVKTISFKTTGSKVLKEKTKHGGGTFDIGTVRADIVAFGYRGLKFSYSLHPGHAAKGATAPVNFLVDGDELLSSDHKLTSTGSTVNTGTVITSPGQNWKHAMTPRHKLQFAVKKVGSKGTKGTLEVSKIYMYPHSG